MLFHNLDLLRDLKRINSHLVAAAAHPILEERGEHLQSGRRARSPGGIDRA
jgi:phosphate:Na+ symporter